MSFQTKADVEALSPPPMGTRDRAEDQQDGGIMRRPTRLDLTEQRLAIKAHANCRALIGAFLTIVHGPLSCSPSLLYVGVWPITYLLTKEEVGGEENHSIRFSLGVAKVVNVTKRGLGATEAISLKKQTTVFPVASNRSSAMLSANLYLLH